MSHTTITNENFEAEVLKSETPVLVDFSATWCGPCRRMEPIIEEIANEYDSKVKVCTADVDHCPDVAKKYGIMSVPTFMMFKGGEVAGQTQGSMPKAKLSAFVDEGSK